jgi:DNA (cytosine-5)-methyltransferase 1
VIGRNIILELPITFDELIKEKRQNLGLSKEMFSELLGLGEQGKNIVSNWELGKAKPTMPRYKKILTLPDTITFGADYNLKKHNLFKYIDLFAGIGGMRLPFQELGGRCVFTSEWDKFSKKTYTINFGEVPKGDITKIRSDKIPRHDLLLAGFPCQAFSQAGLKQGFNDTRGTLFFEIQRILAHHKPRAFLLENVKQLKGHDKGQTLRTILEILRGENITKIPQGLDLSDETLQALKTKLNYRVGYSILKATDFGVPQSRERIYIIGFDKDQVKKAEQKDICKKIFDELKSSKSENCLGDILEKNSLVDPRYTISDRLWSGHQRRLLEHKKKGNGFGYSLFNSQSPYCNTISARYYKDGSEILIDQTDLNKNPRKLTPREAARIQGFPENFNLDAVSDAQNYKQFGNSVSIPVIRAIAEKIIKYL